MQTQYFGVTKKTSNSGLISKLTELENGFGTELENGFWIYCLLNALTTWVLYNALGFCDVNPVDTSRTAFNYYLELLQSMHIVAVIIIPF